MTGERAERPTATNLDAIEFAGSVLHVAPFSPATPDSGGRVRLAATVKALSRNWHITGIYLEDNSSRVTEARRLLPPGSTVFQARSETHFRSARSRWLDRVLRGSHLLALGLRLPARGPVGKWPQLDDALAALTSKPDVALVEFGQMASWRPSDIPSVIVAYDLNWRKQMLRSRFVRCQGGTRRLAEATRLRLEAAQMEREEVRAYALHDAIVVVSEADREILTKTWEKHRIDSKPVFVAPNGVDLTRAMNVDIPAEPGTALFVGGLNHPPNLDAVSALVTSIAPATGPALTQLLLVGADTEGVCAKRIHGVGRVQDVGRFYASAAITVAPIRWGSGTRLKILESLAYARPVVAFPEAAEGLEDLADSGAVVIVDDDVSFARAIDRLLAHPGLSRSLGIAGRNAVLKYDWATTLLPVEFALRHAIEGHKEHSDPETS